MQEQKQTDRPAGRDRHKNRGYQTRQAGRNKQTGTEKNKQSDRKQRQRVTDRQTDKQTGRQRKPNIQTGRRHTEIG